MTPLRFPATPTLLGLLTTALLTPAASGQVAFSYDYQGPTVSAPDPTTGTPLSESDLLRPAGTGPSFGPLGFPNRLISGGELGLVAYTGCLGHPPGTPCGVELDALSHGMDALLTPAGTPMPLPPAKRWWFSVDEYAKGQGLPVPGHASVLTEAPAGDACADVFVDTGLPPGPLAPGAAAPHSAGTMDGNGLPSATGFTYFGVGLVEPNPPGTVLPNPGDNLDALDIGMPAGFPPGGVYFSLDGVFPDPLNGHPAGSSALIQGFSGASVLHTVAPGTTPVLYASAQSLGLDLMGPHTDDLDALVLGENNLPGFQPSQTPYDWLLPAGSRDMLMFSVRRGSAVVGALDSIQGLPIEPGDILVPPVAGGGTPFPGIFIAAENLGLATVRSGTAALFGDDMDALDTTDPPCFDCNGNGVEDSVDIATGASSDTNGNGIPDECEQLSGVGCTCPLAAAPCSNPDPSAGCANSSGQGGTLSIGGTTSIFSDDLSLIADQLPANVVGIVFMGTQPALTPFGDGLRCVGGQTFRYGGKNSGPNGTFTLGRGVAGSSCSLFPPGGCVGVNDTWYFQAWYRDPSGPCGSGYNLTNGLSITFTP